jgi:predicted Fe-S protein YdhL (DUF1289 family)
MAEKTGVCAGCHRTLAEIAAWSGLSEMEKIGVLAAVRQRKEVGKTMVPNPQ